MCPAKWSKEHRMKAPSGLAYSTWHLMYTQKNRMFFYVQNKIRVKFPASPNFLLVHNFCFSFTVTHPSFHTKLSIYTWCSQFPEYFWSILIGTRKRGATKASCSSQSSFMYSLCSTMTLSKSLKSEVVVHLDKCVVEIHSTGECYSLMLNRLWC